jgi:hypothetical protein
MLLKTKSRPGNIVRMSFPMSLSTLDRVDFFSPYVVSDYTLESKEAVHRSVLDVQSKGGKVFNFGGRKNKVFDSQLFAWGMRDFDLACSEGECPYGVLISPYEGVDAYTAAANDDRVSCIAIGSGLYEFDRLEYLFKLVHDSAFCLKKPHWLYGFYNPAELSVIRSLFGAFILSKIDVAVCSASFIYGMYNALFTKEYGVRVALPVTCPNRLADLGMFDFIGYELDQSQLRTFRSNVDLVQAFAHGASCADKYVDRACSIMEI